MDEVVDGIHRFGRGGVNWYLIEGDDGMTVVDAGVPGHWSELTAYMNRSGFPVADLRAVLITHGHADHVGFAERARQEGATIYAHRVEAETLRRGPDPAPPERFRRPATWRPRTVRVLAGWVRHGVTSVPAIATVTAVDDGDRLDVPGRPRVVHVPGHTPGSAAYVFDDHDAVCTGDALVTMDPVSGRRGVGVAPSGLNADDAQALASLDRLTELDVSTLLPGHGDPYRYGPTGAVQAARALGTAW